MYRKRDREQLYLEDCITQSGGKLKADNRWVKEAAIIPWDTIEEIYSMNFAEGRGTEAINSRIAFGAIYIKRKQKLTDREAVEYIAENPYVQYFLGLKEFKEEPLFDPLMTVRFRKRFPAEEVC